MCLRRASASGGSCLLPAPAEGGWRLPASRIVPNFALARVARALCVQSAAAAGWLGTKSHRRTAGARDQARSSGHVEALANRSFLTGQRLRGQRPEKMMAVRLVSMMLITVVRASSHWLDAYEQRGYFVLPRVFSGTRLMNLRAAVARYLRDHGKDHKYMMRGEKLGGWCASVHKSSRRVSARPCYRGDTQVRARHRTY